MGISKLFLKEILEMCDYLIKFPIKNYKKDLNIIFLGDQEIRVKYSELYKFRKDKIHFLTKNRIKNKRVLIELKDLFPEKIQNKLKIKTIDINGNPNLKLDITNTDDIFNKLPKNSLSHFIDIGTIEHVINPYKALCNINELIEEEGFISHLVPCKSYLNHGYYSISPQLLNDFYKSKNYEILRFNTISYIGNYDSNLSLSFNFRYHHEYEIKGIRFMLKKGKYLMAFQSFLRRLFLRISKETYISFTARKISGKFTPENLLYQKQYQ